MTTDSTLACRTFDLDGTRGLRRPILSALRIGACSATVAVALLAITSAPSRADTFNLNVTFGPQVSTAKPLILGGATLTGTYDIDFSPLPFPVKPGQTLFLASYNLTLSIPSLGVSDLIKPLDFPNNSTLEIQNEDGFDLFSIDELALSGDGIDIQLLFPTSYAGSGDPILPDPGTFSKLAGPGDPLVDGLIFVLPGAVGGTDFQHDLPVTSAVGEPVGTVSEPSSLALVAGGLALFGVMRQRRRTRLTADA